MKTTALASYALVACSGLAGCASQSTQSRVTQAPVAAAASSTTKENTDESERQNVAGRDRSKPEDDTAGAARRASDSLPESPDISRAVMGWALLTDGAPIVRAIARVGALGAPAPGDEDLAVKLLLARALGLEPSVMAALDFRRPAAIGVLHPAFGGGETPPFFAVVPTLGRGSVEKALQSGGLPVDQHGWGVEVKTDQGKIAIGFREQGGTTYALIAFRPDLVGAAWKELAPVLSKKTEVPLTVHLDVDHVYAAFGAQLEVLLGRFAQATRDGVDPQIAFALRSARRFTRYADSIEGLELLVGSDDGGVTITARVDGKPGSAFADYVASQHPGPLWGLRFLPKDSVLIYATHRSGGTAEEDLDASIDYLGDAMNPPATDATRAGWRQAMGKALSAMPGEMVYAVWPGSDGGVGLGGAYKVKGGEAARRDTLAAYSRIGEDMAGVVARSLKLDPDRFKLDVKVKRGAMKIGATAIDTVEIGVRWPAGAAAEKKLFQSLFGERLVMATAFVGEQALFAVGHDVKDRLSAMIAAAAETGDGTLADDPRFHNALGYHPDGRVSFTYLPTAGMAGFISRLLHAGKLDRERLRLLEPVLLDAGDGAIVASTNATGARYEMSTRIPTSSLPGLPRIGAVLWRMALSPLLNPPTMPPLPIPPAHVTPPVAPAPAHGNAAAGIHKL